MPTLIFGHKNPDTDTITSAISLSYLKNKLGDTTKPVKLGKINKETEFVLDKFSLEEPELIENVKTQVKDLNYYKVKGVSVNTSIIDCYNMIKNDEMQLVPVVNEKENLIGIVSVKDIAVGLIQERTLKLETNLTNIINGIKGNLLVKGNSDIKGNIKILANMSKEIKEELDNSIVVITSDTGDVIETSIDKKVQLIVLASGKNISESLIDKAKKQNVSIVSASQDIYSLSNLIERCSSISNVMNTQIIEFNENDYLESIRETMLETKRRLFPVVDSNNKFLGMISKNHVINPGKKKVILVDHNEYRQSAEGIEEADIIEIIDHHKIGGISTSAPINFRNASVGSSCTIVYTMFKESNIDIPKDIAGMLISGIVSDTLLFRSPTTTDIDKEAVEELNKVLRLNLEDYAMDMFKAGTSLEGFTIDEIFFRDFKEFKLEDNKVGIGQVFTLDIDEILNKKDDYIKFIKNNHHNNNYYLSVLAITDIINEGSYLLYECDNNKIVSEAFGVEDIQGVFVEELVSRKKQMVPKITESYNAYK